MKAVVLAGGQDYGQCPLSRQLPRALWPLVDRPVIEHVLLALRSAGFGQMAISANGRTQSIGQHLGYGSALGVRIHYSEDKMPRGAAGCIRDCAEWLGDQPFLVVHGASLLINVNLPKLLRQHERGGAILTIATTGSTRSAAAELRPAGLYICEPAVLPFIKERGYQDIKEQLIPRLLEAGRNVRAVAVDGEIVPVQNEECYLNAMAGVLSDPFRRRALVAHLSERAPGLWVDPAARVHPEARVFGPAYVGPGAQLDADAVVIGPAIVGEDCHVGPQAVVHESILWRESKVGAEAMVEQAILAARAEVAPGAEIRGSIVLETPLSAAERLSLSGSTDLTPAELAPPRHWLRRVVAALRLTPAQAS